MELSPEQKWRSEILVINLRINGKVYPEAYNRLLDIDFNLILYLVKFLKMTPTRAVKAVFFHEYRLFSQEKNSVIKSPYSLRMIFNNDMLDLVKCAENTIVAENKTVPLASFVHNPYGDFSIEFLNRYIKDYLLLPKGQS